jgi:hypothetical protein
VEHVRKLDEALSICYDSGLANLEAGIVDNYLKAPSSNISFDPDSYVMMSNFKTKTKILGKFAPVYVGPLRVIKRLYGDFYSLKDLVQDTRTIAHASDLIAFFCSNDDEAVAIAKADYNEFTVSQINNHTILNEDPSKLANIFFDVTFDDGETQTLMPVRNLLFVEAASAYVNKHQPELLAVKKAMQAAGKRAEHKRITKASQRLLDVQDAASKRVP